jgi:riboflavin synthase
MFTGIVEETGKVLSINRGHLSVSAERIFDDITIGDSIAINGICLTVVNLGPSTLDTDLSEETITRTNLGDLRQDFHVNLERALTPNSRMGGHFVQGHIDGKGHIKSVVKKPNSSVFTIDAPQSLCKYIVDKGFIAVDGISLTVMAKSGSSFSISVIPYTLLNTNFIERAKGDSVNLEVDILAKYVENLLAQY